MRRIPLILVSAVLCTAVACGGDDKEPSASSSPAASSTTPSPTAAPMTKAEWVSAVNKICDRVLDEAEGIGEPSTAKDYETALTTVTGIIDRAQTDVRKLTPPAEDAAEIEKNFIGPNDEQLAAYRAALPKVQAAVQANDTKAAEDAFGKAIEEGQSTEAESKWIMDYGLTSCATN